MTEPPRWTVRPEAVDAPEPAALLRAYYTEIVGRFHGRAATPAEVDAAQAEEPSGHLAPPGGAFLVARAGGTALGCAGVHLLRPGAAELCRLYVAPAARGRGGGAALLAAAEATARERLGAAVIRLDTRRDLVEARALYARSGYREIPPYNDGRYADHWFEKPLA